MLVECDSCDSHRDGLGKGGVRRSGGCGVTVVAWMGGAVVLEPEALQRVRRETGIGSDHFQRRFCIFLQPLPARALRDHSYSIQRVSYS